MFWTSCVILARLTCMIIELEFKSRIDKNLDVFERRLSEPWVEDRPKPKIIRLDSISGHLLNLGQAMNALPRREERSLDAHKWIRSAILFPVYGQYITFLNVKYYCILPSFFPYCLECFDLETYDWQQLLAVLSHTHLKKTVRQHSRPASLSTNLRPNNPVNYMHFSMSLSNL